MSERLKELRNENDTADHVHSAPDPRPIRSGSSGIQWHGKQRVSVDRRYNTRKPTTGIPLRRVVLSLFWLDDGSGKTRATMNAYETAQALGLSGSDAEIVAVLQSTGLTARPIQLGDLLYTLNNRGMLIRLIRPADTGEKWAGSVVNMVLYLNASGTPEQAAAVNQWFSHITNDRNNLFDTTQVAFAAAFWSLAQAFGGQPTFPTAADFAAVADLGGGWRFAGLTAEQFAAEKDAALADANRQTLLTQWNTILNESINPALASGDRTALAAALVAASEVV